MRIALIGLGGMGKVVVATLRKQQQETGIKVVAALVASEDLQQTRTLAKDIEVVDDFAAMMACEPDVVAECAGHEAVRQYGEKVLAAGIPLLVISIGVLADDALYQRLAAVAASHNTRLLLPAGAVGGIDALGAARLAGLKSVTYKARKPALAWQGTDAEEKLKLDELQSAACFYRGSAREAAVKYPKNSNVAATVALAGLGFDATAVELIADPGIAQNRHEIEVEAASGSFSIQLSGLPLQDSPKTSALAAYSVAKCLQDMCATVII